MRTTMTILWGLAATMTGCLYSGEGTEGLPCNADTECGGTQRCIERVCGGPRAAGSESGGSGSSEGSGSAGDGSDDEAVAAGCTPSDDVCLPDDVLRKCHDGKLETQGCEGICGEARPMYECGASPDDGSPICLCRNERDACEGTAAQTLRCGDSNTLLECDGKFWIPLDCDQVCVEAGYAGADACGPGDASDTCFCGSSCTEDAARCVGDDDVAYCWNGAWSQFGCDEVCESNGYSRAVGCDYFADSGDAGCACL